MKKNCSLMLSEDVQQKRNSHQVIALFIDVMHGDVVLNDTACRCVADAIAAAYEMPLRHIVGQDPELSAPLRGAINVYMAKRDLRSVPEILSMSKDAATQYTMVAEALSVQPMTADLGKAMLEEVLYLTEHVDLQRFERLKSIMNSIVINLMRHAATEFQQGGNDGTQAVFWLSVLRFISTPDSEDGVEGQKKEEERNKVSEGKSSPEVIGTEPSIQPAMTLTEQDLQLQQTRSFRGRRTTSRSAERITPPSNAEGSPPLIETPTPSRGTEEKESPESEASGSVPRNNNNNSNNNNNNNNNNNSNTPPTVALETEGVCSSVEMENERRNVPVSSAGSPLQQRCTSEDRCKPLISRDACTRTYFLCPETKRYKPLCLRGFFS
ncbi:uncharacterized protein TEOVI_000147400 [Trypanosoma equiperdum]|uniref:Uncharacterized protein n=1 Tax=Trypanosoma equiperdum TaxID=5694 RepID=A0A1G4ICZ2_TRYEQ|nr:hypothetical protein, conserved [Trypanosoma equiperdum]